MNASDRLLPISEIFSSPQGEGVWAGQMQTFIRLAGCTVGKPYDRKSLGLIAETLPIYTEQCTLYDGRKFPCDTDYRVKERMSCFQIMEEIPKDVEHVCITGGEPMMHNLDNLISYLLGEKKKIHIETSGTIYGYIDYDIWVTVSPKFNPYLAMLERANEVKILVDKDFNPAAPIMVLYEDQVQAVSLVDIAKKKPVYLQPVNFENTVNKDNLQRCLEIQRDYPMFRVSVQLHKVIGTTIGELVR